MKTYFVTVEKSMYCSGQVKVKANTPDEAVEKVEKEINNGSLQTTEVEWGELQYEDCSFKTTGDIDE